MSSGIKALSVKQRILNATHGLGLDTPGWELAQFLLLHYDEIDRLRPADIAERCHTSPSTVRRFCQSIGYDNFSDLRQAKLENPENQYEIARDNYEAGYYEPRRMYDEIRGALWNIGQKIDRIALSRLADEMWAADAVLIYALRPYTFVLREFQSQYVSLGKALFVFDGIGSRRGVIDRLGERQCHIALSPAAVFIPAIDAEMAQLKGFKTVIYCQETLAEADGEKCLAHYGLSFPLPIHTQEYNYLEVYGKYAVMFFFDQLFGLIVERAGQ